MGYRIGDAVRLRQGSRMAEMLREAVGLTGMIGDTWTDERGERVSVLYEAAHLYAYGWAAREFEPAPPREATYP